MTGYGSRLGEYGLSVTLDVPDITMQGHVMCSGWIALSFHRVVTSSMDAVT